MITLHNVSKFYGKQDVLKGVSLHIARRAPGAGGPQWGGQVHPAGPDAGHGGAETAAR